MPNLKAAKKSVKQDKKRRLHNAAIISELKTFIKKLNSLIALDKADEAADMLSKLMSKLDKAAKKGLIKRHSADRKKSRLAVKVAKLKH